MKRIIINHECFVIGKDWQGNACSTQYLFSDKDVEKMKDANGIITNESFLVLLKSRFGDLQSITDYRADIGDNLYIKDWETEENACMYSDLTYTASEAADD